MGEISDNLEKLQVNEAIFKDVQYLRSGKLSEKVEEILQLGGATRRLYFSDFVTHCICGDSPTESDISDADDLYEIPAVTQNWVIACARLGKIVSTKPYILSKQRLFSSVTACIGQTSKKDRNSLWALITYYGGVAQINLDTKCTHLICSTSRGARYTMGLSLSSDKLKIVTPDWVTDSINSRIMCVAEIYHPRLMIQPPTQQENKIETKNGIAAITGFDFEESLAKTEVPTQTATVNKDAESTQALLDKLKQRMPWNSPNSNVPAPLQSPNNTKLPLSPQTLTPPQLILKQNVTTVSNTSVGSNNTQNHTVPLTSLQAQHGISTIQIQQRLLQQQQLQQQHLQQQQQQQQQQQKQQQQHQQQQQLQQNQQQLQQNQQQLQQQQQHHQQQLRNIQQVNTNHVPPVSVSTAQSAQHIQQVNSVPVGQQGVNIVWKPHTSNNQNMLQSNQGLQQNISSSNMQSASNQHIANQNLAQLVQKQMSTIGNHQMSVSQSGGQLIGQNMQMISSNQGTPQTNQQILHSNQQQMIGSQNSPINQQIMKHNQQALQGNQQLTDLQNIQNQQIVLQQNKSQGLNQQNIQLNNQQNNQQVVHINQNNQIVSQPNVSMHQQNHQVVNQQNIQLNSQQNTQYLAQHTQMGSQQNMTAHQQGLQMVSQQNINNPRAQMSNQQHQQGQQNQQVQQIQNQHSLSQQQNSQIINQQNAQLVTQQTPQVINQQNAQLLNQTNQQLIVNQQNPQQLINQQNVQMVNQQNQPNQQVSNQNPQVQWQHQQFIQRQQIPNQRGPWPPGAQPGAPQRQLIHLDAQTHAQLQQMDPQQRAVFVAKLQQKQRNLILQRQAMQRGGPRPAQHIAVIRGQVPPGLSPQQQIQWIQQSRPQTVAVVGNTGGAPGLSPISQPAAPFPHDPNIPQQQLQQLQIQRHQQYQRLQQLQMQREQAQKQGQIVQAGTIRTTGSFPEAEVPTAAPATPVSEQATQIVSQQPLVVNSKTKTALANMLNIRLQGGNTVPSTPEQEPSAAGTLRLMTAQHNASLNPVSPRTPQELLAIQQRRAMSTVPNGVVNQAPVTPTPTPQVQGGQVKGQFSPGRVSQALQRSQFYGHNPNLKLPPDLFLLGCIFVIVEYDVSVPHLVEDWKTIIAKHGGEVEPCYCARVTHVLCETQKHGVVMQALRDVKRCVTADWLSDIIMKKQVTPPWLALHLPSYGSKDQKPAYKHILSLSGFEYEERELVRRMIEQSGAKFTGSLSRLNTGVICRRPDTVKARAARDWGVPCLNVQWLSELLVGNNLALHQVDIPKYQAFNLGNTLFKVDYGIVPHLLAAWKSPINITQESHERVKRGLVPPTNSTRAKKPRLEAPPPHILLENVQITCINPPAPEDAPKVLFSQVNSDLPALEVIVKQLGGQVVTDFQEATHLVIGKVQRTPKLLYCLITSDYIVTPAWLMESKQNNTFLPCDKYIAKNEDFEKCFNCDISKVISTKNRRELFKDKIFYITHGVQPSRQFLTDLIELSGGVVEKRRRTIVNIHEQNSLKTNSYIILTCKSDLYFITDVLKSTKTLKVVCNTEVVMSAIMRQELILEPYLVSLET